MNDVDERRRLYELLRYLWGSLQERGNPPPPDADDARALERLREAQADAQARMRTLVREFASGALSADAWRMRMETEIRVIHTLAAALGKGGFGAITQRDLQALLIRIETQFRYLNQWTQTLRSPTPFNEAQAAARAALYAGASSETYYAVRVSALGLPELPIYPGSGDTACMTGCKCHLDIQRLSGNGNWDVRWIVDVNAEHCPDCVQLGQLWSPLEIREGQFDVSRVP